VSVREQVFDAVRPRVNDAEDVMVSDINKLAQSIQDSALPKWLHEYLAEHRDRMVAELKLFGSHEIPMPDGGVMVIRAQ
jgi:hypothetical protein